MESKNIKDKFLRIIGFGALCVLVFSFDNNGYIPEQGFVPDKATASKVAEAILFPIYGNEINYEKPFKVELKDSSVWVVRGNFPEGALGGVAYIEIRKSDCKILKVTHGQ